MHSIARHLRSAWDKWRGRDRVDAEDRKRLRDIDLNTSSHLYSADQSVAPPPRFPIYIVDQSSGELRTIYTGPDGRQFRTWGKPPGQSAWVRWDREHGVWKPDPGPRLAGTPPQPGGVVVAPPLNTSPSQAEHELQAMSPEQRASLYGQYLRFKVEQERHEAGPTTIGSQTAPEPPQPPVVTIAPQPYRHPFADKWPQLPTMVDGQ
jgi:hypothetical protein